jgi:hypothetical protein
MMPTNYVETVELGAPPLLPQSRRRKEWRSKAKERAEQRGSKGIIPMSIIAKCNKQQFTTLTGAQLEAALVKRRTGRTLTPNFCSHCRAYHAGSQRERSAVERATATLSRMLDRFD